MKKLIFLGTELNVNKEHELFPTNTTLGFDAIIVYKDGRGEVRHNLTFWGFAFVGDFQH
jgi:hypothetical protein